MSDTLYVLPAATFYPDLEEAPTGLVGTLALTIIRKSDSHVMQARSTASIVESPADSGHYLATRTAPEAAGEYSVQWDTDEASETIAFDDLVVTYDLPADLGPGANWAPSVEEVAALIRARTKIPGGGEAGTFTEQTRPTRAEVESLIGQATDHVSASIGGTPCNDELTGSAQAATAMLAAILIETSYWPEQAEARGSAAARLEALFTARMKSLTAAVAEQCGGQGEGDSGDGNSGALAAGHFSDGRALVGPGSPERW